MQPAKQYDFETWSPSEETPVRLADADTPALTSPAAQLQDQLYQAFEEAEADERWSYRRTAAFLIVTCGGFWLCVAGLVGQIV